jgi:hypothetical protein
MSSDGIAEPDGDVAPAPAVIRGEIVWMFAYDVAAEIRKDVAAEALSGRSGYRRAGRYRRTPGNPRMFSPLVVELPERELSSESEGHLVRPCVKAFSVGAVCVSLRMPFEVRSLDEIVPLRLMVDWEHGGPSSAARRIAEDITEQIARSLVRPSFKWDRYEDYTAICITRSGCSDTDTTEWLQAHRASVAALLVGEGPPDTLAQQQVEETLRYAYSFNTTDLAVIDWDAMLIVDQHTDYEEVLFIAETANMQLVELRVHDELLERAVDNAYTDLDRYYARRTLFKEPQKLAHSLREQRIDLAKIADQIFNVTKYFGDWHLARIYDGLQQQFHLAEWEDSLETKLRTVDSLYGIISKEITDRNMFVLELMIVVLFVLDVIIIVAMG